MDKKMLVGSIIAVAAIILVSSSLGVIAFASEETPFVSSESFAVLGNIGTLSRDQEEIHYYDPDTLIWHVIGLAGGTPPYIWESAIRLTQDELSAYMGWKLTKVVVALSCDNGQSEVYSRLIIYGEGTPTRPGNIIYEKPDLHYTTSDWHIIEVDTPIALDDHDEIWVSMEWEQIDEAYIAVTDEGPAVDGKGDWIYWDGAWSELQKSPYLDYNWAMGAIVEGEGKVELSIVNVIGPVGVNAGVRNIGDKAAVNLEYEMTVTGGILGLVNRTKVGSKTTLNPSTTEYINSGFLLGFGPITINIAADADNAFEVVTTKTGFILGPFVLEIK